MRYYISGMKLYCLVLNYKCEEDTKRCVRALKSSDLPRGSKILVLDNSKKNLGFAGGNNIGVKKALKGGASHVLIINPDVTVGKTFFKPLLDEMKKNNDLGIVAPAIRYVVGKKIFYGLEGNMNWRTAKPTHVSLSKLPVSKDFRRGEFVTFACALIKTEVFKKIGLIDERYFMYLEDVDFCLSTRKAAFDVGVTTRAIVDHKQSASFKKPTDKLKISFVSHLKFIWKWMKFPRNVIPLGYQLLFYPYLYCLWSIQSFRHRQGSVIPTETK